MKGLVLRKVPGFGKAPSPMRHAGLCRRPSPPPPAEELSRAPSACVSSACERFHNDWGLVTLSNTETRGQAGEAAT